MDTLRKLGLSLAGFAILALVAASDALAVFPVDEDSETLITGVKADIVAWGVVFIGVALTVFAYKRIRAMVR